MDKAPSETRAIIQIFVSYHYNYLIINNKKRSPEALPQAPEKHKKLATRLALPTFTI
jgi:hypothetical protein